MNEGYKSRESTGFEYEGYKNEQRIQEWTTEGCEWRIQEWITEGCEWRIQEWTTESCEWRKEIICDYHKKYLIAVSTKYVWSLFANIYSLIHYICC